jgi:transposase
VAKIEKALTWLEKRTVEGKLKDRDKMLLCLGRIQASHPQVADLYEMAVKDSKEGPRLVWRQKPQQQQWLEAREGAYLLRTNLTVNGAADLWKKYMQLTEVEAAFRTLKSELAIRPLFHQLEKRVKAHVLVAFLGYALQVTLKHLLKRSASEYSPAQTLKRLAEIRSVDIVLPTVEGREIWLRRIARLDELATGPVPRTALALRARPAIAVPSKPPRFETPESAHPSKGPRAGNKSPSRAS